ncbi:MAG: hypothetical protein ACRCVT_10130 [Leadbetterella sp.]
MDNLHFDGDFVAKNHLGDSRYFDSEGNLLIVTIGGCAYFRGWTGSANKLTSIGGCAYFGGWTGSANKLTSIGGSAYFRDWTGSANKLTSIGGSAYFGGWTGSANKLTSIGGYAYFRGWTGSANKLKHRYIWENEIGSRKSTLLYDKETDIFKTGCFSGDKHKFIEAIKKTHGNNRHAKDYMNFIEKVTQLQS